MSADDQAAEFLLDADRVMFSCPDCGWLLWLDGNMGHTLGDVIDVANAHECPAVAQ